MPMKESLYKKIIAERIEPEEPLYNPEDTRDGLIFRADDVFRIKEYVISQCKIKGIEFVGTPYLSVNDSEIIYSSDSETLEEYTVFLAIELGDIAKNIASLVQLEGR